jgi:hypothetical protein
MVYIRLNLARKACSTSTILRLDCTPLTIRRGVTAIWDAVPHRPRRRSSGWFGRPAMSVAPAGTAPVVAQSQALDPSTRLLLQGSIVPTLLRLAWPNILGMRAQASTGLIETWWVSRLGTDALAGIAPVFLVFMVMPIGSHA